MKDEKKPPLAADIGKSGRLAVGDQETNVALLPAKKQEIDFVSWTIYSADRPAREELKKRLRGSIEVERLFYEIGAQMAPAGTAECTQQQLALELDMKKGNVSRALKILLEPEDADSQDPLKHELVRRVGRTGFIINPAFAVVGIHAIAWQVWYENAPPGRQRSEEEVKEAEKQERREEARKKAVKYRRGVAEIRADRKRKARAEQTEAAA